MSKVTEDMPVFTEETFGPVIAIVLVENEEKAIELANKAIRVRRQYLDTG